MKYRGPISSRLKDNEERGTISSIRDKASSARERVDTQRPKTEPIRQTSDFPEVKREPIRPENSFPKPLKNHKLWQTGTARLLSLFAVIEAIFAGYLCYHLVDFLINLFDSGAMENASTAEVISVAFIISFALLTAFLALKGLGSVLTVIGNAGGAQLTGSMLKWIKRILLLYFLAYEGYLIYIIIRLFTVAGQLGASVEDMFSAVFSEPFLEVLLYSQIIPAILVLNMLYLGNMSSAMYAVKNDMQDQELRGEGTGSLSLQAFLLGAVLMALGLLVNYAADAASGINSYFSELVADSDILNLDALLEAIDNIGAIFFMLLSVLAAKYFLVAVANRKLNRYRYQPVVESGSSLSAIAGFQPFFTVAGAVACGTLALYYLFPLVSFLYSVIERDSSAPLLSLNSLFDLSSASLVFALFVSSAESEFLTYAYHIVPVACMALWAFGLGMKRKDTLLFLGSSLLLGLVAYLFSKTNTSLKDISFEDMSKEGIALLLQLLFCALLWLMSLIGIFAVRKGGRAQFPLVFNLVLLAVILASIVLYNFEPIKAIADSGIGIGELFEETGFRLYLLKLLVHLFCGVGVALSVGTRGYRS